MAVKYPNKPTPTKFSETEREYIARLHEQTGESVSEIIRRCVWLLYRETKDMSASEAYDYLHGLAKERQLASLPVKKKATKARRPRAVTPVPPAPHGSQHLAGEAHAV